MNPNKYPGVLFIGFSFAFAWAVIFLTTAFGIPANTLHASAQAWSFSVIVGILVAYGLSWFGDVLKKGS